MPRQVISYLNNINIDFEDFVNFRIESEADLKHTEIELRDSVIVPIGGGKDSIVTLNLLSEIEKEKANDPQSYSNGIYFRGPARWLRNQQYRPECPDVCGTPATDGERPIHDHMR